jgi:hypothetical protein
LLDAERGPSRWTKRVPRYTNVRLRLGAGMRGNGVGRVLGAGTGLWKGGYKKWWVSRAVGCVLVRF